MPARHQGLASVLDVSTILSRPVALFRRVAIAEAITWALLLFGMFLKYGPVDNPIGVKIFGMVHGVVFIAYVVTTAVVWVDQQWSWKRGLLALGAAMLYANRDRRRRR